jgi:diaminopimelate decarboxylase
MTTAAGSTTELLGLFPPGARVDADGELVIGGCRLADLSAEWGTPLYVIDEAGVRAQVRRFRRALDAAWPNARMVFASKAFPSTPMYRLMAEEGIGVDVAGPGELAMALAGGVDPARIVMHGNAKTTAELRRAVDAGVGLIVIDNTDDIDRLDDIGAAGQPVLIRVLPGVRPDTYDAVATGQAGSKFGLPLPAARAAIDRLRGGKLRLDGLHLHIGSQILDTEPFARAVEAVAALGTFDVYDIGGGLGVRYTLDEQAPTVEEYLDTIAAAAHANLPPGARLIIEPGRSLVAESCVTLYRVTTVKRTGRTFVAVDGGMADNLDAALTGQPFTAGIATRLTAEPDELVELVGRQCESGDLLVSRLPLPGAEVGDLIAMPVTGAYTYTMANNYNGALRPPIVFCRDGQARLAAERETHEHVLALHRPALDW